MPKPRRRPAANTQSPQNLEPHLAGRIIPDDPYGPPPATTDQPQPSHLLLPPNIAAGIFPKRRRLTDRLPTPEDKFQAWIRRQANIRNWADYCTWNSKHSPRGWPDLTLIRPPRIIFAEVKNEEGNPTNDQIRTLQLLCLVPWVETYLWYPEDSDDIIRILDHPHRPSLHPFHPFDTLPEDDQDASLRQSLELWDPNEHQPACMCPNCQLVRIVCAKLNIPKRLP